VYWLNKFLLIDIWAHVVMKYQFCGCFEAVPASLPNLIAVIKNQPDKYKEKY